MRRKAIAIILGIGVLFSLGTMAWASAPAAHGAGEAAQAAPADTGHGAAEGAHGAEGGHHALPWGDFFLRVLNFGIMVAILVKLLKKPMANFFRSRREGIQKTLTELDQQREDAEKKAAEYKAKLAALDQETQKIIAEYVQEGEAERQKIIEAAQRQAEYIKEQARLAIQQEMKAARDSLQEEVAELSVSAAEEILRKSIGADDHKRLVQEFLTKVVEAK